MFIQKVPLEGDTLALGMPVRPWQFHGLDFVLALEKKKRLFYSIWKLFFTLRKYIY